MISFHTDQMIAYIFAVNIESTTVATFRTTKNYQYFNLSPNHSYKINWLASRMNCGGSNNLNHIRIDQRKGE